ncbi:hypothetical protein F4824DRAFT_502353 [Ustulina deusta]|nr:hypothetical protein F4824DRAFT_502353 [Ustulina deusta]
MHHLVSRGFFTTETGYIRLTPKATVVGDEVCVVLGCSTAMVLRPTADDQQKQTVGPCYIEGFDDGEAVLDLLPTRIKCRLLYNGRFEINIFGEGEVVDPRLKGWIDQDIEKGMIHKITELGWHSHIVQVNLDDLIRHGIRNARYLDLA